MKQLSQTLSVWLWVLDNHNNGSKEWAQNLLTSHIAYVRMIYDLLEQILDPCTLLKNRIGNVETLYNRPESIITQKVAVYLS